MTLPPQEAAWPETGEWGCGLGCDQEKNTGSKGRNQKGTVGERPRVPGSKARPGKQTVSHRWVMLPGTKYHLPSLPLPRNWPTDPDRGSIRGGGWVQPGLQEKQ